MIRVTRSDPLGPMPKPGASTEPMVLSTHEFKDWPETVTWLRERGIPVTDKQAAEIASHEDTQFVWREWQYMGETAALMSIHYALKQLP